MYEYIFLFHKEKSWTFVRNFRFLSERC